MNRKQRRATYLGVGLVIVGLATATMLYALQDSLLFFRTPSDVITGEVTVNPGQRFRLGGLVERGSVARGADTQVAFAVTDTEATIPVTFSGVLPDLFREGQGVIAEGALNAGGVFVADKVLAKHDETYMPREVAEALKEKGVWQGTLPENAQ
ncbi:MAG: cytochrome c maturation protein CcmE [Pseudomonadota bacterium]